MIPFLIFAKLLKLAAFVLLVATICIALLSVGVIDVSAQTNPTDTDTATPSSESPFESGTIYDFQNNAELKEVEFGQNQITVYIQYNGLAGSVQIAPAVTETGPVPSQSYALSQGENVFTLESDAGAVTITTAQDGFAYFDDSGLNITRDVSYPWILSVGGMSLLTAFIVGIVQLRKKKSNSPKIAVKK